MMEKPFQIFMLLVCVLVFFVLTGCTTEYIFEFQDAKSSEPISNMPVEVTACPQLHSFFDLRHYTASGEAVTREGYTDDAGKSTLSFSDDIMGIASVCLDGKWFARRPSSAWQPMLTRKESEMTQQEYKVWLDDLKAQARYKRPLIRVRKK